MKIDPFYSFTATVLFETKKTGCDHSTPGIYIKQ